MSENTNLSTILNPNTILDTNLNINQNINPTIYLKDYQPSDFNIENIYLDFELFDDCTYVSSKITFTKAKQSAKNLILVGNNLKLISVYLNGDAADYVVGENHLQINDVPDSFVLTTQVEIHPETNTSLEGLYKLTNIFSTQCEAQGFRHITYFLDRPDVMTKYQVRIEADKPKYPILLSNGNLIAHGDLPNNRHFVVWQDPFVKPCYLFALVAGKLSFIEKTVKTKSNRDVLLQVYTEPKFIHQADFALDALHRSLKWDEENFNLECDLERYMIVAISDFNMGAMENKGLNIFNTQYVLATPKTATDNDFLHIEAVIAHEYFHNWTGNRVTCRDWFQLSLKEGLTVFRDSLFTADSTTKNLKRLIDSRLMRELQFVEDAGPLSHPVRPDNYIEINNFYTLTVYDKGAEVIRMMYNYVGEDKFKKGIQLYFSRHDGHAVTVEDFVRAISDAANVDLFEQFFLWYIKSGTPTVQVKTQYNSDTKSFKLELKQSLLTNNSANNSPDADSPNSQPLMIPLTYQLFDNKGNKLSDENTIMLTQATQSVEISDIAACPVLSILRGFSAPVKVDFEQSETDLAILLRYDDDLFVRYDALIRLLKLQVKQFINHETTSEQLIVDALITIINSTTPAAEKAELLTLPSLSVFYDVMDEVNVIDIYNAWQHVKYNIVRELKLELLKVIHDKKVFAEEDLSFKAISERSFDNACLVLLGNLSANFDNKQDNNEINQLAAARYQQSQTMTNKIAALNLVNQFAGNNREDLLNDFYKTFADEPQVIDKWLALHATFANDDCVTQIIELTKHKAFNLNNPNKVRAVFSSFANKNPAQFHRLDGKGYELLADYIIKLDDINPSIAARLLTPLTQYKVFASCHQNLMKNQVQRILNKPKISKDLYEIASKSLR